MAGIKDFVSALEKKMGKGVVAGNNQQGIDFISSGSISLDIALGGGYPVGRIVELIGYESSGKTTLALTACREVQKGTKRAVLYIDCENAIDMDYVQSIGVDVSEENFVLCQPGTAEESLSIMREGINSPDIGIIILDSVAAMFPKCYLLADVGDAKMGVLAKLMSVWLPGFIGDIKSNKVLVIFINQFREKIGVVYGSPSTTPGGKALGFYSSQRLEISKNGTVGDKGEETANHVKVRVSKNKVAPPLRKAEFDIRYGEGIDSTTELLEVGSTLEVVQKSGSFYKFKGVTLGQGVERARQHLLDNPKVTKEIFSAIMEKI